MSSPELSSHLDRLFARRATPRSDLTERILERVRQSDDGRETIDVEAWLGEALRRQPAIPREAFVEETLGRIRSGQRPGRPAAAATLLGSALAACLAFAVISGLEPKTVPAPESTATFVHSEVTEEFDVEAARILALAESLDHESRWLLEEHALTTLASAY